MDSDQKTLISWKYFFSDLNKRQYDEAISETEFIQYPKSVPNLKFYIASYKFDSDLPSMDFMMNNYIQGIYQRLRTPLEIIHFLLQPFFEEPKRFASLWIFDVEQGNKFLLEIPKKSKSENPEETDYVSEDKDIYELFEWQALALPLGSEVDCELLVPFFTVTDNPRFVYK